MLSHIYSCGLSGIDGFSVCVETDISNGLPAFDIVGLPDAAVKEAKERIRSAIKNTNILLATLVHSENLLLERNVDVWTLKRS